MPAACTHFLLLFCLTLTLFILPGCLDAQHISHYGNYCVCRHLFTSCHCLGPATRYRTGVTYNGHNPNDQWTFANGNTYRGDINYYQGSGNYAGYGYGNNNYYGSGYGNSYGNNYYSPSSYGNGYSSYGSSYSPYYGSYYPSSSSYSSYYGQGNGYGSYGNGYNGGYSGYGGSNYYSQYYPQSSYYSSNYYS